MASARLPFVVSRAWDRPTVMNPDVKSTSAFTTTSQPADCMDASASMGCQTVAKYPGSINIWVNVVEWSHPSHGSTACMCQYGVVPAANDSPLDIGTMAKDAWFAGAIGKVALYDELLSQAEISSHYRTMTGKDPTGSCQSTCKF